MKHFLLFVLAFFLCTTKAAAQTEVIAADTTWTDTRPWAERLRARLDSVLASPLLETTQIGFMVYDLTADSVLYTRGHRQRLRPASTMKLLTAITALDRLGADYQLRTQLYITGRIAGRTLIGNVVCVGGMDPMFDRTDMQAFVSQLRQQGIDAIQGRIVADTSFKDADRLGEGWCWDDDNPVLSPLLCDRKDTFVEQFTAELKRAGVSVSAQNAPASQPRSTRRLVATRSHSVGQVLVDMMKESDNLYAESLFYQLATQTNNKTATAKLAASQVRQAIQRAGLDPGLYRVADGSGLSLYNYVSAELEVAFLRYAWQREPVYIPLYDALPIAGVDGTLKSRMLKTLATDNVHAKTGSVSGISSLAGYCTSGVGHQLAFCIINQGVRQMSDGRGLQDQLCEAMCQR